MFNVIAGMPHADVLIYLSVLFKCMMIFTGRFFRTTKHVDFSMSVCKAGEPINLEFYCPIL